MTSPLGKNSSPLLPRQPEPERINTMDISKRQKRLSSLMNKQNQKMEKLQFYRLIFGLSTFALLILSQILKGYSMELIAVLVTLPLFMIFFYKTRRVKAFIEKIEALNQFYKSQQSFKNGEGFGTLDVEDFKDPQLARDLDLHELLPAIDLSFSKEGADLLNQWLCQQESLDDLPQRQQWTKELTLYPGALRRLFMEKRKQKISFENIDHELKRSFFEKKIAWKWLLPITWVTSFALIFSGAPSITWKVSFFIYLASTMLYLGETKAIFSRLQDLLQDLNQLSPKLEFSKRLSRQVSFLPQLKVGEPQQDIRKLKKMISLMSVKANPLLFYLLNLIVPWSFFLSEKSERIRVLVAKHFSHWSKEMIFLEACGSLANISIYHKTSWPKTSSDHSLSFKGLAHPLLDQNKVVTNNFSTSDTKRVFIITGSNMSGKSTFLRALGINFCLARAGGPVFANDFHFPNFKLVSCIRVSDSLRDGQSYFYAEVKRMKTLLEEAKKSPILFLIDEPLRGTNNKERLQGNQSYLKQILDTGSMGFLSTHDLELTQLSQVSDQVDNYHFSEDWNQEDLHFNYKIQDGPSQSTNALKILQKEGLYSPAAL